MLSTLAAAEGRGGGSGAGGAFGVKACLSSKTRR